MAEKMVLATTCVSDNSHSHVQALEAMYDAELEINFKTFAKHCDWREWAEGNGYAVKPFSKELWLSADWAVRFYRSKWKGRRCYYMDWSSIDHVFLPAGVYVLNNRL